MNSSGSVRGAGTPLALLPQGSEGIVKHVGADAVASGRLADIGLVPAARVRILISRPPGDLLVMVKQTRIALDREIAMKIIVKEDDAR